MHPAIPHPAGLFSGRMAAQWTAAAWATGVRRAPQRRFSRALLALAIGVQLGLALLVAQVLGETARQHRAALLPALAVPAPSEPAMPALPFDAFPDPAPPPAPEAEPMPNLASPPTTAPAATGRIADADDATDAGRRVITVVATAYCPCPLCCGESADGHTAIMRDAHRHRGIAVDPTLIPYRTMLEVPGYGRAMVDDTGEAMRRDGARGVVHIDVRFRSHEQAKAWGVRTLQVAVPADCRAATLAEPAVADADE